MSPSKIRLKTVTAKAELVREMLAAIETLPLATEADFSADMRMVAAGESFLRRSLEGLKRFEAAAHGALPQSDGALLQ
jgi:hypothetical protein